MKPITPGTKPPWAIAHRGFSAHYPENTTQAFRGALATEIQGIECDVQLSRDEVPVIFHDRTLAKIGGGFRRVRTQRVAELKKLDVRRTKTCKGSCRMPTLDEVLRLIGRRTILLLEIKLREVRQERRSLLIHKTVDRIASYGLEDYVMILSYDEFLLQEAHSAYPKLQFVWNRDKAQLAPEMPWLSAYSVRLQGLTKAFIGAAHAEGKPVLTFTCNSPAHLKHVIALGVDGIMSDHPAWLVGQLKKS